MVLSVPRSTATFLAAALMGCGLIAHPAAARSPAFYLGAGPVWQVFSRESRVFGIGSAARLGVSIPAARGIRFSFESGFTPRTASPRIPDPTFELESEHSWTVPLLFGISTYSPRALGHGQPTVELMAGGGLVLAHWKDPYAGSLNREYKEMFLELRPTFPIGRRSDLWFAGRATEAERVRFPGVSGSFDMSELTFQAGVTFHPRRGRGEGSE